MPVALTFASPACASQGMVCRGNGASVTMLFRDAADSALRCEEGWRGDTNAVRSVGALMARVRVQQSRSLTSAEKADIAVAKAAALKPRGTANRVVDAFGCLGDQEPMAAASATMLACGLAFRDRQMARAGVRMLGALGLATFIKSLLKDNIDRTRPGEVIENRRYRLKPGSSKSGSLRSMPSGHSAGATAVLRAAAREYPAAAVPLVGGALAIAAAQLPTRNHFVTDITAGVALGLACEKVASLAIDRAERWIDER